MAKGRDGYCWIEVAADDLVSLEACIEATRSVDVFMGFDGVLAAKVRSAQQESGDRGRLFLTEEQARELGKMVVLSYKAMDTVQRGRGNEAHELLDIPPWMDLDEHARSLHSLADRIKPQLQIQGIEIDPPDDHKVVEAAEVFVEGPR